MRGISGRWRLLGWLLLVLCGCAPTLPPVSPSNRADIPKQLQVRQVIVTLASPLPEEWGRLAAELKQHYDLPQVGAFPLPSLGLQCVVFQIPVERALDEIVGRLAADPRVESVQRNQTFYGLATSYNDPYLTMQHGVHTIRADLVHRWATGRGVKVAIVDTGVETEHPDLRGRVVASANFVDGGEEAFARDIHGTAVAGVIASLANNRMGIVGVAPEASLIALKACWHATPGTREALCSSWTLAKAVDFAIRSGAQILNLSLAGPPDPLLTRLMHTLSERRITVVAATFDRGDRGLGFPASLDTVLAIRASDVPGQVRSLVPHQPTTVLTAPGTEILTTVPQHTYDFVSGSSLAAAHVTGIIALLLERAPDLTPPQIAQLLRTSVQPAAASARSASEAMGVVDACRTLAQLVASVTCS